MNFKDLKADIKELLIRKAETQARIDGLLRKWYTQEYDALFAEVTSKPIDWTKMSWPTESNGDQKIQCIVCMMETRGEYYLSGGPVPRFYLDSVEHGSEHVLIHGARIHVHRDCLPAWVKESRSLD